MFAGILSVYGTDTDGLQLTKRRPLLRAISTTALLVGLALPFRAEAQSPAVPSDPSGSDFRVTTVGAEVDPFVTRGFVRGDSLVILSGGSVQRTIPLAGIEVLEVGRRNHLAGAWLGLWGGALAGATVGGAVGLFMDATGVGVEGDIPATPYGIAGGVLLGAPVGMLVLGVRGLQRWNVISPTSLTSPSEHGATVHLRPQLDGRLAVQLNILLP